MKASNGTTSDSARLSISRHVKNFGHETVIVVPQMLAGRAPT